MHLKSDMESEEHFLSTFDGDLKRINEALESSIGSRVPVVEEISRYSVLAGGKRLRPLLFVLSSCINGNQHDDRYRYSAIFEMIHAASLLHDDVLDNAESRRKKPSAACVWGNHSAVLGGDFLYAKSVGLAIESGSIPFLNVLTQTTIRMTEGQMLELAHTNDWALTSDQYMQIITAKTAVLISAACSCGGILAGAGEKQVEELGSFGLNLGIAFQLKDDLLDYTSTEEIFGKPVGKDLREGKITLPLIKTFSMHNRERVKELEAVFKSGKASEDDYERMIVEVRESSGLEDIRAEAREYVDKAAQALDGFQDSPVREKLLFLNQSLLNREF
jgi:octaprenyl-diphosphate synthase